MQALAFMSNLALSQIAWYNAFHIQTTLLDVSLQRGLYTTTVLGEN